MKLFEIKNINYILKSYRVKYLNLIIIVLFLLINYSKNEIFIKRKLILKMK